MTDFDLGLDGLEAAIEELEQLEQDVETTRSYTVGTAVNYSVTPMPSQNKANSGKRYVAA
jgi:hypothetical protein